MVWVAIILYLVIGMLIAALVYILDGGTKDPDYMDGLATFGLFVSALSWPLVLIGFAIYGVVSGFSKLIVGLGNLIDRD